MIYKSLETESKQSLFLITVIDMKADVSNNDQSPD